MNRVLLGLGSAFGAAGGGGAEVVAAVGAAAGKELCQIGPLEMGSGCSVNDVTEEKNREEDQTCGFVPTMEEHNWEQETRESHYGKTEACLPMLARIFRG